MRERERGRGGRGRGEKPGIWGLVSVTRPFPWFPARHGAATAEGWLAGAGGKEEERMQERRRNVRKTIRKKKRERRNVRKEKI